MFKIIGTNFYFAMIRGDETRSSNGEEKQISFTNNYDARFYKNLTDIKTKFHGIKEFLFDNNFRALSVTFVSSYGKEETFRFSFSDQFEKESGLKVEETIAKLQKEFEIFKNVRDLIDSMKKIEDVGSFKFEQYDKNSGILSYNIGEEIKKIKIESFSEELLDAIDRCITRRKIEIEYNINIENRNKLIQLLNLISNKEKFSEISNFVQFSGREINFVNSKELIKLLEKLGMKNISETDCSKEGWISKIIQSRKIQIIEIESILACIEKTTVIPDNVEFSDVFFCYNPSFDVVVSYNANFNFPIYEKEEYFRFKSIVNENIRIHKNTIDIFEKDITKMTREEIEKIQIFNFFDTDLMREQQNFTYNPKLFNNYYIKSLFDLKNNCNGCKVEYTIAGQKKSCCFFFVVPSHVESFVSCFHQLENKTKNSFDDLEDEMKKLKEEEFFMNLLKKIENSTKEIDDEAMEEYMRNLEQEVLKPHSHLSDNSSNNLLGNKEEGNIKILGEELKQFDDRIEQNLLLKFAECPDDDDNKVNEIFLAMVSNFSLEELKFLNGIDLEPNDVNSIKTNFNGFIQSNYDKISNILFEQRPKDSREERKEEDNKIEEKKVVSGKHLSITSVFMFYMENYIKTKTNYMKNYIETKLGKVIETINYSEMSAKVIETINYSEMSAIFQKQKERLKDFKNKLKKNKIVQSIAEKFKNQHVPSNAGIQNDKETDINWDFIKNEEKEEDVHLKPEDNSYLSKPSKFSVISQSVSNFWEVNFRNNPDRSKLFPISCKLKSRIAFDQKKFFLVLKKVTTFSNFNNTYKAIKNTINTNLMMEATNDTVVFERVIKELVLKLFTVVLPWDAVKYLDSKEYSLEKNVSETKDLEKFLFDAVHNFQTQFKTFYDALFSRKGDENKLKFDEDKLVDFLSNNIFFSQNPMITGKLKNSLKAIVGEKSKYEEEKYLLIFLLAFYFNNFSLLVTPKSSNKINFQKIQDSDFIVWFISLGERFIQQRNEDRKVKCFLNHFSDEADAEELEDEKDCFLCSDERDKFLSDINKEGNYNLLDTCFVPKSLNYGKKLATLTFRDMLEVQIEAYFLKGQKTIYDEKQKLHFFSEDFCAILYGFSETLVRELIAKDIQEFFPYVALVKSNTGDQKTFSFSGKVQDNADKFLIQVVNLLRRMKNSDAVQTIKIPADLEKKLVKVLKVGASNVVDVLKNIWRTKDTKDYPNASDQKQDVELKDFQEHKEVSDEEFNEEKDLCVINLLQNKEESDEDDWSVLDTQQEEERTTHNKRTR